VNKRIIEKIIGLDKKHIDVSNWPTVFVDGFTQQRKDLFMRRKQAIDMYFENDKTVKEISKITGIEITELRRFVKRCDLFSIKQTVQS
jgi:putative transposase